MSVIMDPWRFVGGKKKYEQLLELSYKNGFELEIKNAGQHWMFHASGDRLIEWWPSTGRVVINKDFAGALRRFNTEGIIELQATVERPKKPAPDLRGFHWSVWTDGSCDPNPGRGGAAFIAQHRDGRKLSIERGFYLTTISRMELVACAFALQQILEVDRSPAVVVFTDSKYTQRSLMEWIKKWRRNGWRTQSGEPVENRDLLEAIDELVARCFVVRFQKVKSHRNTGSMNDQVDEMARSVRKNGPWQTDHGYLARIGVQERSIDG